MGGKDFDVRCLIAIFGAMGVAFVAIAASSEQLVKFLFGPGYLWFIIGPVISGIWAYFRFCRSREEH